MTHVGEINIDYTLFSSPTSATTRAAIEQAEDAIICGIEQHPLFSKLRPDLRAACQLVRERLIQFHLSPHDISAVRMEVDELMSDLDDAANVDAATEPV